MRRGAATRAGAAVGAGVAAADGAFLTAAAGAVAAALSLASTVEVAKNAANPPNTANVNKRTISHLPLKSMIQGKEKPSVRRAPAQVLSTEGPKAIPNRMLGCKMTLSNKAFQAARLRAATCNRAVIDWIGLPDASIRPVRL